jgi:hypothetical protein
VGRGIVEQVRVIRRHQEAEATLGEELCRGKAGDGAMRGGRP